MEEQQTNPVNNQQTQSVQRQPILNTVNSEFVKWQLDVEPEIKDWVNELSGTAWNDKKGIYIKISNPVMNDTGIMMVTSFVKNNSNKIAQLSNMSEEEIDEIIEEYEIQLDRTLFKNASQFQLDYVSYADTICLTALSFIRSSVYRSKKGFAYNGLSMTTTNTEVVQERQKQKEGRWFGFLKI